MKDRSSVEVFNHDVNTQNQLSRIDTQYQEKINNYSSVDNNAVIVPSFGSFNQCISIVQKETKISQFFKYIKIIDSQFGVSRLATTEELMESVVSVNDKQLTVLSGYAHLLLAEQLKKQNYDLSDINKEISKAEALLDFANLGGNSPLLPRVMKLKRRVNWKSFSDLAISSLAVLLIIVLIGMIYQFMSNNDIDLF